MSAAPATKRISQLTQDDFDQSPIWQLIDPSRDEVRPWPKKGGAPLISLVRLKCRAADGSVRPGFGLLTKISVVSPVLFAQDQQIALYHGNDPPTAEFKARAYSLLGLSADALFPIEIQLDVSSQHRPLPVTYEGFMYRSPDGGYAVVR